MYFLKQNLATYMKNKKYFGHNQHVWNESIDFYTI
jgi:hypothetical protein